MEISAAVFFPLLALIALPGLWFIVLYQRLKRQEVKNREDLTRFESMVSERTKNLEMIRDSLSEYAVQKFELAQELESKNLEISTQKDALIKHSESLKAAYDEITKLESFRHKMTRMIVHDLKNPLNIIINIADTINVPSDSPAKIKQLSLEMLGLIMNILEVNKLESLKMKINPENFDLGSTCRKLIEKHSFLLMNSTIGLKIEFSEPCYLYADKMLTQRILENLISNSVKYTGAGGQIVISACDENGKMRIEVKDNGKGIPQNILNEVFDEYVHDESRASFYSNSTGIGLAYCRLAVEAQGGNIGISSIQGKGTTVWFTLAMGAHGEITESEKPARPPVEIKQPGNLQEEDILAVSSFISELKTMKIFEVSAILKKLHNEKFESNERLCEWRNELEKAVFRADEDYFRRLLGPDGLNH